MDARIEAIRSDKNVGRGSCTALDECYSDGEIIAALNDAGIPLLAVRTAVTWAYEQEGLQREQALNARWGEDDDPQLASRVEWDKVMTYRAGYDAANKDIKHGSSTNNPREGEARREWERGYRDAVRESNDPLDHINVAFSNPDDDLDNDITNA